MGGRGRGRGRGAQRHFLQQELGFGGRGEQLVTQKQPPPLYPDVNEVLARITPCPPGEKYDYQLAMMQEFRRVAQKSPMFPPYEEKKHDIERYTDRLRQQDMSDSWEPDYSRLPEELRPVRAKKKKKRVQADQPSTSVPRPLPKQPKLDAEVVVAEEEVEALAQKAVLKAEPAEEEDQADGVEEEEEEEEELEEGVDEDALDEDDEGDYGHSYFDNGEGYDDDGDDSEEAL